MKGFREEQLRAPEHAYVHVPYCLKKCPYCDFCSYPAEKAELPRAEYVKLLLQEIRYTLDFTEEKTGVLRPLKTLYFGGGTPALLEPEEIRAVIELLAGRCGLAPGAELTLEMNPAAAEARKLKAFRQAGINRLSIGLQTADDRLLKKIGRVHSVSDFLHAYGTARELGYANVNTDLMLALPGQTLEDTAADLDFILHLDPVPEHLSVYSLIIEENTPFSRLYHEGEAPLPDDKTERAMYHYVRDRLEQEGLLPYEISNHAKPGFCSRHNTAYWEGKSYYGFGASASSYLLSYRRTNPRSLKTYKEQVLARAFPEADERIDEAEAVKEFFIFRLRKAEGFSEEEFRGLFGRPFSQEEREILSRYCAKGLLAERGGRYFHTDAGLDFSDEIARAFL